MPRSANLLAKEFRSHLSYLETTRRKVERLASKSLLVRRDIEQVYSGLYLDAVTSLEHFIEDLFMGLLVGKVQCSSGDVHPRVVVPSYAVARDVVYGRSNYVDWFPYERTEGLGKVFFRDGLPFTRLARDQKREIETLIVVRNALAHQSPHARLRFEQDVIGNLPLIPREKTPTGFLRSPYRSAPVQTRYEYFVTQMVSIYASLC